MALMRAEVGIYETYVMTERQLINRQYRLIRHWLACPDHYGLGESLLRQYPTQQGFPAKACPVNVHTASLCT